jgi:hypothetical protein
LDHYSGIVCSILASLDVPDRISKTMQTFGRDYIKGPSGLILFAIGIPGMPWHGYEFVKTFCKARDLLKYMLGTLFWPTVRVCAVEYSPSSVK